MDDTHDYEDVSPLDATHDYGPDKKPQDPDENLWTDVTPYQEYSARAAEEQTQVRDRKVQQAFLHELIVEEKDITEDYFSIDGDDHVSTMFSMFASNYDATNAALLTDHVTEYFVDLVTLEVFRVDDDTSIITEEEMAQFPHLVNQADHK